MAYFRQAIADPASVPPWSEWWAVNVGRVEAVFPLVDYVRLKHRRLLGARQILQISGELPRDYAPPSPLVTGSCGHCGERTSPPAPGPGEESVACTRCGFVFAHPGPA